MIIVLILVAMTVSALPLVPDCKECINIPVMLQDAAGTIHSSVVLHPGDNPSAVAREACIAIKRPTDDCLYALLATLEEGDWMAKFQEAATASFDEQTWSMSRHEKLTILKRLRTFEQPRRLLVIGAGPSEATFWMTMNSRKQGGFTCFVEREVPVPESSDAVYDVLSLSQALSDAPFTQIVYDVETAMSPTRQWRDYDMWEMQKEIPSNYSLIPWDAVILYDICRDADDAFRPKCTQLYFDYALDRTVDDGFFFVQFSPEGSVDMARAEEKFMYRFDLSHHLGSKASLRYYSSLDTMGMPTISGMRQQTESRSAASAAALTACVRNEFETAYTQHQMQQQQQLQQLQDNVSDSNTTMRMTVQQEAVNLMTIRGYSRVIGVLFCCRKRYSSILQGYLERNLVIAGGLIDHILIYNFGTSNDDPTYPAWLATQPGFVMRQECSSGLFGCAYATLGEVDAHALYIKFDDDLLFIGDGAVEAMVTAKCRHPSPTIVHGNGINHLHTPYLHTLLSQLSHSSGSSSATNGVETSTAVHTCRAGVCPAMADSASPTWEFYGRDWQSPAKAQEQHTAFLSRMAVDMAAEQSYWFDKMTLSTCRCSSPQPGTGLCSKQGYYRTSINLVCFDWMDIRDHIDLLSINDEIALTVLIPERTGHGGIISGKSLYAHAAFTPQRESAAVGKLDERKILQGYWELAQRYLHQHQST